MKVFFSQDFAGFHMRWVDRNTVYRTHFHTLAGLEVPHAFGATGPVNLVDLISGENGIIGAFRFTDITVDAFGGDI